jgi:hypothetical protein
MESARLPVGRAPVVAHINRQVPRHTVEQAVLVGQLGQRRRFLQRRQILPLQISTVAMRKESSLDKLRRISTGTAKSPSSSPRCCKSFRARKRRSPLTMR